LSFLTIIYIYIYSVFFSFLQLAFPFILAYTFRRSIVYVVFFFFLQVVGDLTSTRDKVFQ